MFTLRPGDGVLRVLELGFGEVFESLLMKIDGSMDGSIRSGDDG